MLVYVALQLLSYLVTGPWKDPNGHNFPQTAPFTPDQMMPKTFCSARRSRRACSSPSRWRIVFWIVMSRSEFGLGVRVVGDAPKAARYAGFNADQMVWRTLLISGGMAGLAGVLEAASQSGQLNLGFPSGYGFTAIIVSFLGPPSAAMGDQLVGLFEGAFVEQELDALASRHLALLVLACPSFFASAGFGQRVAAFQLRQFLFKIHARDYKQRERAGARTTSRDAHLLA